MTEKKRTSRKRLSSRDLVTLAVYLLGGENCRVDTEDVAMQANKLAPGRFAWRKYNDQINLDAVRKRLWDAKSPSKGPPHLMGSEEQGWSLTEAGICFCRAAFAAPNSDQIRSVDRVSRADEAWWRSERSRLLSTPAFSTFSRGLISSISDRDCDAFFRLDEYVSESMKKRKVTRIVRAFADDAELGPLVRILASRVRGA